MLTKIRFLFLGGLLMLGCLSITQAYEPSDHERDLLAEYKIQLNALVQEDNQTLWSLYQQMRDWTSIIAQPEALKYQFEHLRNFLLEKIEARMQIAKLQSQPLSSSFLEQYQGSGLQNADPLSPNCYGRYHTLDMMSFAYDLPTALTIAVWRKESNCGFYRPKNGDWPFQIVNKDYGTWALDRAGFELAIKDFLEFSKKKIDRHNSKNPETPIGLSYTQFKYDDLYKFAALYNGLSGASIYGDISPAAPRYFFEKMPGDYEKGKRNGLFLQFLRVLEWELAQNKS